MRRARPRLRASRRADGSARARARWSASCWGAGALRPAVSVTRPRASPRGGPWPQSRSRTPSETSSRRTVRCSAARRPPRQESRCALPRSPHSCPSARGSLPSRDRARRSPACARTRRSTSAAAASSRGSQARGSRVPSIPPSRRWTATSSSASRRVTAPPPHRGRTRTWLLMTLGTAAASVVAAAIRDGVPARRTSPRS